MAHAWSLCGQIDRFRFDAPIALLTGQAIREEDALDGLGPQNVAPVERVRVGRRPLVDAPVAVVDGRLAWDREEDDLGAETGLRAGVRVDAGVQQGNAGLPIPRRWTGSAVHEEAGEEADEVILLRHRMP